MLVGGAADQPEKVRVQALRALRYLACAAENKMPMWLNDEVWAALVGGAAGDDEEEKAKPTHTTDHTDTPITEPMGVEMGGDLAAQFCRFFIEHHRDSVWSPARKTVREMISAVYRAYDYNPITH